MSDSSKIISSEMIDEAEFRIRTLKALIIDITSIENKITSFTERVADGEEIDEAALTASNTSATLLYSRINAHASLMMKMANDISDKAKSESARINTEFQEIRNDARRADALRRGIIPFAGGDGDYSVLSILAGAHSIGGGIFGFLTMIDSNKVRGLCHECRQAVMDFPWMDTVSIIKGSVQAWRAAFPVARAVNVSARNDIIDADFVHIRGDARVRLHTVNIGFCKKVTDAAFVHLRGIHTLGMSVCNQVTITDAAFVHLHGIHALYMRGCNQVTITDAAFVHLRGIHTLYMSGCNQVTITDAAFVHLRGIHTLYMSDCNQVTITDAAFVHLRGIATRRVSQTQHLFILPVLIPLIR